MKNKVFRKENGITLVALVVTIIVLIILAGVSINLVLGDNGIITKAREARDNYAQATSDEQGMLDTLNYEIESLNSSYNTDKGVNAPILLTGMTKIQFNLPETTSDSARGSEVAATDDWYEYGTTYETKRWANAKTQDGSMWVWIPRYAYKINSSTHEIDVKFLIDTTDNYYDENGQIKTAQRQTSATQTIDTTADYTVHPAFTNESSISYANGGWDKELTGIWVAKFEAGYAGGNNSVTAVASSVNYENSDNKVWTHATERGQSGDGSESARNWQDGIYGSNPTAIKYPVFMPTTYSMNYINHNDAFKIAKLLTSARNPYGLNSAADSHMMKNSEWGAVAYLTQSKYGRDGEEIAVNNANLNSNSRARTSEMAAGVVAQPDSVFAITGCTSGDTTVGSKTVTIAQINAVQNEESDTANGVYIWNEYKGQFASTTKNMYGIYDLSGGVQERTAGLISNANGNLNSNGKSVATEVGINTASLVENAGTSTKYATIYPHASESGLSTDNAKSQSNFANFYTNSKMYGDATRETASSNAGTNGTNWSKSSWNDDFSRFPGGGDVFFVRGGYLWHSSDAGAFAFSRSDGYANYINGFRAVLVVSSSL